jgi:hypothetical protein
MTTQTLSVNPKSVPFTLSLVEGIDQKICAEAINSSEKIKQSYNPKTQLSSISIYAGTSLTYSDTGTFLSPSADDTEQSDT